MNTRVLISDKSIPFASALADLMRGKNSSVALICGDAEAEDKGSSPDPSLVRIPLNRSSSLSVRTLILEVKNNFASLDQAVLVFDTPVLFESVSDAITTAGIVDEYIKGYLLLVNELSVLFALQKKGRFLFVVRPSSAGAAASPSRNIPVSVAEAAFMRLAEETALSFASRANPDLQAQLIRLEAGEDPESLAWLAEQLEMPSGVRGQGRWIKAGSRGLFGKL
jgi:hypothetical protein